MPSTRHATANSPALDAASILAEGFPHATWLLDTKTFDLVMAEAAKMPKPLLFVSKELHGKEYDPRTGENHYQQSLKGERTFEPQWDGIYLSGRFGNIPLPVHAFRGWTDDDQAVSLSRASPAANGVACDGKSVQVFLHKSIPFDLYNVVLFHELVECELYTFYGVPRDIAHTVATLRTNEYVQTRCAPDIQVLFAEFNSRFSQAAA